MKIPKDKIMKLLRDPNEPGDQNKADQAQQDLPNEVDTDNAQHQSKLEEYGIDAGQLMRKIRSRFGGKFGL